MNRATLSDHLFQKLNTNFGLSALEKNLLYIFIYKNANLRRIDTQGKKVYPHREESGRCQLLLNPRTIDNVANYKGKPKEDKIKIHRSPTN